MDEKKVEGIISKHKGLSSALIGILLDVQEEFNYLPRDAILKIAERLKIPPSQVVGLATFFKSFSLVPRGKHPVRVCMGTACHVQGAKRIIQKIERDLNVKSGETTEDRNFDLDEVNCMGCCGLAPVVTVGNDLYGKLSLAKIPKILKNYT